MIIRLLLLSILTLTAAHSIAAQPPALVCYTAASVAASLPVTSCVAPQWHTPAAGQPVMTQAQAWIAFSSSGTVPIAMCTSPLGGIGKAQSTCPAANLLYQLPCKALGSTCASAPPVTPPAPVAGTATISWTAVTTDTTGAKITLPISYNVYRAPTCGGATTKVGTTAAVSYVDKGVLSGSSYGWTVTALDTNGESAQTSPQVCLTIAIPPIANAPATPAAVTAK
jgi:hypothetical protein